jgi:hypothetical protein
VWNTRNRWVFEQRDLPPVEASVKVILSVFASHLRFIDRVWRTSTPKTQALKWFQAQLLDTNHTPVTMKPIPNCCSNDNQASLSAGFPSQDGVEVD